MQYSVRTRRRLRPPSGELTSAQLTAAKALASGTTPPPMSSGAIAAPLAEGTGATKSLPITGPVIERISVRARRGTGDR